MQPGELEGLPEEIIKLFYDMQNRVMDDVVRRIHKTGGITSTADYQINRLIGMGQTTEFIEAEIKRLTKATYPEIWEIYDQVVEKEFVRNRVLYEQINANYIPYSQNHQLQAWVEGMRAHTLGEFKNISQSLGFMVDMGHGKKVFTPLSEYYQKYVDRACLDIVTGTFDYNTVLRRVSSEMSESGLRTVDYASGISTRATVAARRAIMSGVNQVSANINIYNARQLGTNDFEITWHSGHRPDHWWGGLVMSYEDLVSVCGYGTAAGLLGANCKHNINPFVRGASTRLYTDEQLAKMERKEAQTRTYNDKEYNACDATQKQRDMERKMQVQRSKIVNLKKGSGAREDIEAAQSRYLQQLRDYKAFSGRMGIEPQMERVYVDRLGRVVNNWKYSA